MLAHHDLVLDLVERRGELVAVLEVSRLGGVAQRAEVVELGGGWAATEDVRVGGFADHGLEILGALPALLLAEVRDADHHVGHLEGTERGVVIAERGRDGGVLGEPSRRVLGDARDDGGHGQGRGRRT